ncbi:MAG: hypothetical protein WD534_17900 [Phycisphaeraceae bacterium]
MPEKQKTDDWTQRGSAEAAGQARRRSVACRCVESTAVCDLFRVGGAKGETGTKRLLCGPPAPPGREVT